MGGLASWGRWNISHLGLGFEHTIFAIESVVSPLGIDGVQRAGEDGH
jgi:hypothetical protein